MAGATLLGGCRGRGGTTTPAVPVLTEARLFAGTDGRRMTEAELLAGMGASDVVLIGEQHGHPLGLELMSCPLVDEGSQDLLGVLLCDRFVLAGMLYDGSRNVLSGAR